LKPELEAIAPKDAKALNQIATGWVAPALLNSASTVSSLHLEPSAATTET
jgi:hypothetical protein